MIDYKKKYEEAIKELRDLHRDYDNISTLVNIKEELERIFPELKESEDERIRTALIEAFETSAQLDYDIQKEGLTYKEVVAYLKRQKPTIDEASYQVGIKRVLDNPESYGLVKKEDGGQFFNMVPWKGDNLKQVVKFTGKSPKFDEWFKTWEDFENYVHSHNNIFKIFNEDGSHYEVPVGAWIIKTPDGYNVPSKYTLKQKSKEWTEEDEKIRKGLISILKSDFEKDTTIFDISVGDIIAWLEKRGENKLLNDDKYQTVPVETLDRLYAAEKELEQIKEGQWSEYDIRILKEIIDLLEGSNHPTKLHNGKPLDFTEMIYWLKALRPWSIKELSEEERNHEIWNIAATNYEGGKRDVLDNPEKYGLAKAKEWTEEDQRILKEISHYCFSHTDNAEWYNWLISLSKPQTRGWKHIDEEVYVKEPVIAQKKNKTDMFGGYVLCADAMLNPKTYERYIKVSDIEGEGHWKPTSEQMYMLNWVANILLDQESAVKEEVAKKLNSLYNDLKKL